MKSYTKKQISEMTGLPPRMVTFYTEQAVVTPEIDQGKGRGHLRRYSEKNLFEFAIIKQLKDYGINISTVKEVVQSFSDWDQDSLIWELFERRPYLFIRKNLKEDSVLGEIQILSFGDYGKKKGKNDNKTQKLKGKRKRFKFLSNMFDLSDRPGDFGERAVVTEGNLESAVSVLVIDLCALYEKIGRETAK